MRQVVTEVLREMEFDSHLLFYDLKKMTLLKKVGCGAGSSMMEATQNINHLVRNSEKYLF